MTRNTLSESISSEKVPLSPEAILRANTVAKSAIAVLEENHDAEKALKLTFHEMISKNFRDNPQNIGAIQKGLYEARDARLASLQPSERLSALESFSRFMEGFTQNIAHMQRDIGWSNESNAIRQNAQSKMDQVRNTYREIIQNDHPTQTA